MYESIAKVTQFVSFAICCANELFITKIMSFVNSFTPMTANYVFTAKLTKFVTFAVKT
jgi:hypothetical protein